MSLSASYPVRLAASLISVALILTLVYLSHGIFTPVALGFMFAILLRPIVARFHERWHFPFFISVIIAVLTGMVITASVVYFICNQVGRITEDWNTIQANLTIHYKHIQEWVQGEFGISFKEQEQFLERNTNDLMSAGKERITDALNSFTGILANTLLVPFYTFLILIYRNLFIVFILKLFHDQPQPRIFGILLKIKTSIYSYLKGTVIEMIIVSALTSVGLMIVGMKYAILLGVLTGILNLIPYIGILVAAVLTMVATLTNTAEASTMIGVIVVNVSVQLIDNNLLVPLVVSPKVKINSLVTVILILIGSQIAGIAGMFLAIPLAAILKIIFDEVKSLEPWGYLMGDEVPKTPVWQKLPDAGTDDLEKKVKDATLLRGVARQLLSVFGGRKAAGKRA